MSTFLRRWPMFNSSAGFILFFMGFSGTGYYGYRLYNDSKFSHPLVVESVRLISANSQIAEIAGYPVALKTNIKAKAIQHGETAHFQFQVEGPKGGAYVELFGRGKSFQDLKDDDGDYYILPDEIMKQIVIEKDNIEKLQSIEIPPETKFWKIDHLNADIGMQQDYRITLVDGNKLIKQDKNIKSRKNMADLLQEVKQRQNLEPQTEQEAEEQRKLKNSEMYRKMGQMRMGMCLVFIFGGMAIYNYVQKNRRRSVLNSQLHMQALELIKRSQFVKNQFGLNIQFSQQLRGGSINDFAEFETDMIGAKNKAYGYATIRGLRNKKTNEWEIESIEVKLKDPLGNIQKNEKII